MNRVKSYIFVAITTRKGGILFYLLTKTIATEAGDL
jgi:hypothetical protein